MKNTFSILVMFFAAIIFAGTLGCGGKNDKKTDSQKTEAKDAHVHGEGCNHDHDDDGDDEAASPAGKLPGELPAGAPVKKDTEELPDTLDLDAQGFGEDDLVPEKPSAAGNVTLSKVTAAAAAADAKPSEYAPAKVAGEQLAAYVDAMEGYLKDKDEFAEAMPRITRDANTVIALALVLGLHDEANEYKAAAPAIIKAAKVAAKEADYATVAKNVAALKAALKSTADDKLSWDVPVASMKQMMVQVPLLDSKLKSAFRRFDKKDVMAGQAVTIAVLCQASMANVAETEAPAESAKWVAACKVTRDDAAALYAAIAAGNKAAAQAAYDEMAKSCDICHETFHKSAVK